LVIIRTELAWLAYLPVVIAGTTKLTHQAPTVMIALKKKTIQFTAIHALRAFINDVTHT
jgi:hypothetical protein